MKKRVLEATIDFVIHLVFVFMKRLMPYYVHVMKYFADLYSCRDCQYQAIVHIGKKVC